MLFYWCDEWRILELKYFILMFLVVKMFLRLVTSECMAVYHVQQSYVSLVMSKDLVVLWISQLKRLLSMSCHYFTVLKVCTHWKHFSLLMLMSVHCCWFARFLCAIFTVLIVLKHCLELKVSYTGFWCNTASPINWSLMHLIHVAGTVLSNWHCHINSQCHITNTTSVQQQSLLRATTHTTKVRTTSIFQRRTGCLELFAIITSKIIWHSIIQMKL